jgi:hypothetical protein
MIRTIRRKIAYSVILCACIAVTACAPSSNFLPMLNAIVVAAQAALPILSMSGTIPAPAATAIGAYLNTITVATTETTTELESTDPASLQATKITSYWAAAVLDPSVVNNLPPQAQNLVRAVQASVQAFVAAIMAAKASTGGVSARAASQEPVKLSWGDSRELHRIDARAKQLQLAVAK